VSRRARSRENRRRHLHPIQPCEHLPIFPIEGEISIRTQAASRHCEEQFVDHLLDLFLHAFELALHLQLIEPLRRAERPAAVANGEGAAAFGGRWRRALSRRRAPPFFEIPLRASNECPLPFSATILVDLVCRDRNFTMLKRVGSWWRGLRDSTKAVIAVGATILLVVVWASIERPGARLADLWPSGPAESSR
jgi:hypothetical protein